MPCIIIPRGNDQFAWGRRVYELGVDSKPIPRKKLTAENLSSAIEFVLAKEVRSAASELGLKIQNENKAETAAAIITKSLEQSGSA